METRIPKSRYNGSGINTEERKAQQTAGKEPDNLKKIETEMDKRATDIAITVSDMFKLMAMTAAMLPNMELDTGLFRLKVDDDGIFFEISHSFRKRKKRDVCEDCEGCDGCGDYGEEANDFGDKFDYDDDEEGLLYDGD